MCFLILYGTQAKERAYLYEGTKFQVNYMRPMYFKLLAHIFVDSKIQIPQAVLIFLIVNIYTQLQFNC